MNPHSYVHLIFDKGIKNIREKRQPLLQEKPQRKLLGKLDVSMQKTETSPMSFTCTRIISKWVKDPLSKLVQERAGNTLELIGTGNDFLNRPQVAQQLRERIDK
jgi:hypothetical protein